MSSLTIRPVASKADRKAFVDFAWDVYRDDPAWIPPLKDEVRGLLSPRKNPWFEQELLPHLRQRVRHMLARPR